MRLHRLEVTAFGPFADLAEVDFDELSAAGLFLLCGPTGAGKTSVLDAVCFALYGDVPGDRSTARRLRCDTAPEGRAPRVVLEATLSGRRFRITRAPQWSRPKKRGSGVTTEQASLLVEERLDGGWVALSSRIDEGSHFLTGLIGMTLPQFCQVAMLPQGRFQAFLRARSEERHTLLQQLFGTRRFEDVEKWLRERSRILHRESRSLLGEVARVTSRILEVSAAPPPGDLDLDDPAEAAGSGALASWAVHLVATAGQRQAEAGAALAAAQEAEQLSAHALAEGRRVAVLQRRRGDAVASLARMAAESELVERRRTRAEAARKAAPVVPLHKHALATAQQRDRLGEKALTAEVAAAAALGVTTATGEELGSAAHRSRTLLARAEALLPRQAECDELTRALASAELALAEAEAQHAKVTLRLAELPARLSAVRRDEGESRRAAAEAPAARADEQRLQVQLAARSRIPVLEAELDGARTLLAAAVSDCQARKEVWLDLREARLGGMAAEIAAGLAVGACCPVCGSADHPHKAVPAPDAPDAAAEKAARSLVDDAEVAVTALEGSVRDLTTTLAVVAEQAGDAPLEELRAHLASALERAAALEQSAATLPELESRLRDLELEAAAASARATGLAAEQAELRAGMAASQARLAAVTQEIDGLLAGSGAAQLTGFVDHHRALIELVEAALQARADHEAAAAESLRADEALAAAVAELDFATPGEALAHVLGADELAAIERQVEAHDRSLAAARDVLAEPDVDAVAALPPPDLGELEAGDTAARRELGEALARHRGEARRAARLAELHTTLREALAAWTPVRDAHAVATELASFVEGKSADNQLRMRLSAYVLAWRLAQVVAAANERLLRMSDQRYTLEHTDRRGAGESRGGLSMLVRDAWSGETRDPATLSGGETFVVSLALALGLADVVTGEAGGAELDTLFVDEGFGALDGDTLDDVMDTLDTLRDGGRVVGVVSHVGELRTRIPTRLQVGKARHGSTLALVHSAE